MKNTKSKGFTLIEIMIAVVIIGILAAIAVPNYENHIINTKRGEAKAALVSAAQAIERYKSANNFSYLGVTVGAAGVFVNQVPVDGGASYYTISLSNVAASTYTLTATATGVQAGTGNFTLTHTGVKTGWD